VTRPISSALGLALAATSLACAVASCSSFSSSSDAPPDTGDGGSDAPSACSADLTRDPSNCGACGVVCPATAACESGACRPGCADKKLYVSTLGDDASDGCTIAHPMKTIGAAVARVKAIGAKDHEVTVCRGAYRERALAVDYPVSVRGGFECSQFTRTKDFGYPLFDAATETIIDDGNEGVDRATLTVTGAAVTRSTVIDGFTINGATEGAARSIAVSVLAGASVKLTDLRVEGGGTIAATGVGSRGIGTTNASPEITRSVVHGGTGTASDGNNPDIIGIHATGGAPFVHDVQVTGATSVVRLRSIAILLDGAAKVTGASAWHDVAAGGGQASLISSALLMAGFAELEITKSSLSAGVTSCAVAGCSAVGIAVLGGTLAIDSSQILGGEVPAGAGFAPVVSGISIDGVNAPPSAFTNNVIVAGNLLRHKEPSVLAVILARTPGARFVHNTVIVPEAAGGPPAATAALWLSNGATNVEVDDNLLVGENGTTSVALRLDRGCNIAASSFKTVRGNAFVGLGRLLDQYAGASCTYTTAKTLGEAQSLLTDAMFAGNVRLATDCAADAPGSCRACVNAAACAPTVLTPWSASPASPSPAELFGPGYTMPASAPCLVAQGAVDLTPSVDVDGAGNPRPKHQASIGASQIKGACGP
jgi:hypothetical protein